MRCCDWSSDVCSSDLRGATVTAQQVKPDLAIVFEGSPADDFYYRTGVAQDRKSVV